MTDWRRVRLGDVLSLEYGMPLPSRERDPLGMVPVAGSNGLDGRHNRARVPSPGIVVGRKGSAGSVYWSDKDFWPIDTTYYVVPKVSLEMRWAYYLLSHLRLRSLATSTGVPGLNRNDVYALEIGFPSVSEQRRIVDLLDKADGLCHLGVVAETKAFHVLPALFREVFGDPTTNRMGWPVVPLRQLGKPHSGGAFPRIEQGLTEGELPFIKVSDMNTEGNEVYIRTANNFVSTETLERLRVNAAPEGTTVFPKIGAAVATNKKRLLIRDTAFDNNVIGVVPHDNNYSSYLFGFFQLFDLRTLTRSTAVPSIKSSELASLRIPKPHPAAAQAFAERFRQLSKTLDGMAKRRRLVDGLFRTVVHCAFDGSLTAAWREAHMTELLQETEKQAKALAEK